MNFAGRQLKNPHPTENKEEVSVFTKLWNFLLTHIVNAGSLVGSRSEQTKLLSEGIPPGLSSTCYLWFRRPLSHRVPKAEVNHQQMGNPCVCVPVFRLGSAHRCSSWGPGGGALRLGGYCRKLRCCPRGVPCCWRADVAPAPGIWKLGGLWLNLREDLLITLLWLECGSPEQAARGTVRFLTYAVPCSTFPAPDRDSFPPLSLVVILKFEEVWRQTMLYYGVFLMIRVLVQAACAPDVPVLS